MSVVKWCTASKALRPARNPYMLFGNIELDSAQCTSLLLSIVSTSLRIRVAKAIGRNFVGSFLGIAIILEILQVSGINEWSQRALSILHNTTNDESDSFFKIA